MNDSHWIHFARPLKHSPGRKKICLIKVKNFRSRGKCVSGSDKGEIFFVSEDFLTVKLMSSAKKIKRAHTRQTRRSAGFGRQMLKSSDRVLNSWQSQQEASPESCLSCRWRILRRRRGGGQQQRRRLAAVGAHGQGRGGLRQ